MRHPANGKWPKSLDPIVEKMRQGNANYCRWRANLERTKRQGREEKPKPGWFKAILKKLLVNLLMCAITHTTFKTIFYLI